MQEAEASPDFRPSRPAADRILSKLGLQNRAQAVVFAYQVKAGPPATPRPPGSLTGAAGRNRGDPSDRETGIGDR